MVDTRGAYSNISPQNPAHDTVMCGSSGERVEGSCTLGRLETTGLPQAWVGWTCSDIPVCLILCMAHMDM